MSHTLQYHTDLPLLWWTFSLISPNEDFLSVILVVIPDVNTYLLLIVSISKVCADVSLQNPRLKGLYHEYKTGSVLQQLFLPISIVRAAIFSALITLLEVGSCAVNETHRAGECLQDARAIVWVGDRRSRNRKTESYCASKRKRRVGFDRTLRGPR